MRLYLDASAIIYGIEGAPASRNTLIARVAHAEDMESGIVFTSRLSRLECRVKPLRDRDTELLKKYDEFFTRRRFTVVEISAPIVEKATELRAGYGFKTPEAIHLATAIAQRADLFLTGDAALARCAEVTVGVL